MSAADGWSLKVAEEGSKLLTTSIVLFLGVAWSKDHISA